jgi:hypothetical protein
VSWRVSSGLVCFPLQFNQLRADFEYNLQLLEDRDAELAQYDSNAALQAAAAADKDRQLSEMQAALQHALSGEVQCTTYEVQSSAAHLKVHCTRYLNRTSDTHSEVEHQVQLLPCGLLK